MLRDPRQSMQKYNLVYISSQYAWNSEHSPIKCVNIYKQIQWMYKISISFINQIGFIHAFLKYTETHDYDT